MKIVCFHLNQIGDLVFSLPSLKSLKVWNPEGKLISVARPVCKQLLDRTSLPDVTLIRQSKMGLNRVDLVRRLKSEKPDAAVLFSQSAENMLLAYLSGASRRYGITTPWLDKMLTSHVACSKPPSVANNLAVLELMGCPPAYSSYVGLITPKDEDRQQADRLLSEYMGIESPRIIVIAPGTSSRRSVKAWTVDGWASVVNRFSSLPNTSVVLVGTDDVSEIMSVCSGKVMDLTGKTDLPVLLALLEKADVVVGVDSGILHLAAAVGVRVVGLFGMSDPKATGPQGEGHTTISAGLECSPCQLSTCKRGNECMLAIDKERVIAAVESVMAERL